METQTQQPEVKHRKAKKLPVFVSADDLLAILKVSKHKHHKFTYMMGWYSGLRISEILNLEPRDIDMVKGTVFVRQGKGSKDGVSILCPFFREEMFELMPLKKIIKARARRWRNCRRRACRFDNREKKGFIAPSQLMMVQSRLKAIQEFFKYYPISKVAIEDVKFNHRDKHYGNNFSTIEIGKNMIKAFIIGKVGRDNYITFEGFETEQIREKLGLKKSSNKSLETFNSHCVDSFSIASELSNAEPNFNIKVIDDTYRPTRRRLHDTQPKKRNIREKYSTGNFKGIKKGTVCEFGQIAGGTRDTFYIRNKENKRISKSINKVNWLSHNFKLKEREQ